MDIDEFKIKCQGYFDLEKEFELVNMIATFCAE